MSEQEYIDYFEALASKHKAIGHTPEQPRFYVVTDDNRAELESAVRTKLKLPALVIDQYYDTQDRTSDNYRAMIMGGLSVVVKCTTDYKDIRRARTEARQIALSFINRMYYDCRNLKGSLVSKRILPSMISEGEPAPVIGGGTATGWGYGFEWTLPTSVALSPDDWSDLG